MKAEYDKYMATFETLKESIVSDSPHLISEALVSVSGVNVRIGQIIANLRVVYLTTFTMGKEKGYTDKHSNALAETAIFAANGISLLHFEKLEKSFLELIRSLKKRLRVLEVDNEVVY